MWVFRLFIKYLSVMAALEAGVHGFDDVELPDLGLRCKNLPDIRCQLCTYMYQKGCKKLGNRLKAMLNKPRQNSA
jgi:hypothetical protein